METKKARCRICGNAITAYIVLKPGGFWVHDKGYQGPSHHPIPLYPEDVVDLILKKYE